jgi:preprotein translocase subunit SecB
MASKGPKDYPAFLATVQPVIIGLDSCEARIVRSKYFARKPGADELRLFRIDLKPSSIEDDHFDVVASFAVHVRPMDEQGEPETEDLIRVEGEFYAHFHTDSKGSIDEAHVKRFANHEARVVFMPYVRQLVTDLTARMSIPPLMIPIQIGGVMEPRRMARHSASVKRGRRK